MDDKLDLSRLKLNRDKFLTHLIHDLRKAEEDTEKNSNNIKHVEETIRNIKTYNSEAEFECMIPLTKRLYLPGRLVHTGEYFVEHRAHPESFTILRTHSQTIEHLEKQIEAKNEISEILEKQITQLNERINLFTGQSDTSEKNPEIRTMPEKIESDKGVALKVGDFYEIVEYEE